MAQQVRWQTAPDAKRLKKLAPENAKLKKLLAEQMFEPSSRTFFERSQNRIGAACAGAGSCRQGVERATGLGARPHKLQRVALRATAGRQCRVARAHPGASTSAKASGRSTPSWGKRDARELQARGTAVPGRTAAGARRKRKKVPVGERQPLLRPTAVNQV